MRESLGSNWIISVVFLYEEEKVLGLEGIPFMENTPFLNQNLLTG